MQRRKAQWFIIGGLTIITMILSVVLSRNQVQIGTGIEPWQKYVFDNIKTDSRNAINSILAENATSGNIEARARDYSNFLRNFGNSRGVNITSYFIIGLPSGNGINVSVVNFEKRTMQPITITVNGTTQSVAQIPDTSATTLVFSSVPDYFTVNYTVTEIDALGNSETDNQTLPTTKRAFSAIKVRIASKDGSQIWQNVEWN
ncbi:Uncharacterised protein [uncultured archaeon]|nr:Uncharacterised protein [uncultured archaeon]